MLSQDNDVVAGVVPLGHFQVELSLFNTENFNLNKKNNFLGISKVKAFRKFENSGVWLVNSQNKTVKQVYIYCSTSRYIISKLIGIRV